MGWKNEIFRAFFLTFGVTQLILNASYLIKIDGMESARKQHKELPKCVTDRQMQVKVMFMLVFGTAFFVTGLNSYFLKDVYDINFIVPLILFSVYAIAEAFYYKYWKTYGEAALTIILVIIFIFL